MDTVSRVAVVCVHGVAAHPRYEFQDQVAGDLCSRLNERAADTSWKTVVINPSNVLEPGTDDPRPTVTRVCRADEDGPATYFDVTEAYWSPLDKGSTNWLFVLSWLFRTVFAPFNTAARIEAPFAKQFFDYGFIGGALVLTFGLFGLSIYAAWRSLNSILTITGLFRQSTVGQAFGVLNSTVNTPSGQPVAVVLWLLVGIVGAFLVGQALAAIFKTWQQREALSENRGAIWHRAVAIGVLTILGTTLIYAMARAHFAHGSLGWDGVAFLVIVFIAFQIGRGLLVDFIVGFFGDVQIYTTRDENDARFFGLRDEIMDTAVTAMMRAVSPRMNGGIRYDRVIVVAHSLGATIATDALAKLRQACGQGALTYHEFGRIRAFIMLGSSLEKTRYFFNVAGETPSQSFQAWRGSTFEAIFGSDPELAVAGNGERIFWTNYWYFQDPICNEMRTYGDVCRNEEGHKHVTLSHPLLHSDYLDDPWFWFSSAGHLGALDIITGNIR